MRAQTASATPVARGRSVWTERRCMGYAWEVYTDMDVYERPCPCRRPVPAIQRRGPGPEPDLPPAHTRHRHRYRYRHRYRSRHRCTYGLSGDTAAIAAAIARTPSTPATARNTARTLPRKRDRHTDPVRADATSALHVRAQRSRRIVCSPVCNTCVRQPHAGRSAVAAPVRSGRCRDSGSARSPAVLAVARATAERNTTAELQR